MQGHLFCAAFLRHVPLFIRNLSENVVLCLAAAAVESTAKTMLAHMELRWRRLLTSRMHSPYFENMVCPMQSCGFHLMPKVFLQQVMGTIASSCTLHMAVQSSLWSHAFWCATWQSLLLVAAMQLLLCGRFHDSIISWSQCASCRKTPHDLLISQFLDATAIQDFFTGMIA